MSVPPPRLLTGSDALDSALGGGIPSGFTLLVEGPHGVGSTEFALTLLRSVARASPERRALFLTAMRSAARVRREAQDLFGEPSAAKLIEVGLLRPGSLRNDLLEAVQGLRTSDCVVLESTSTLARSGDESEFFELIQQLSDLVGEAGAVLVLLHSPGTLPPDVEANLQEVSDAVFTFAWREGGEARRGSLTVSKLRGLGPVLLGQQVPIFEASLLTGVGFSVSRVRSVV